MSSSINTHPPASDTDVTMASADADEEIEMLKRSVAQLEAETDGLFGGVPSSDAGASSISTTTGATPAAVHSPIVIPPEKEESDRRSVHISQVEYATTSEQLKAHFDACGQIVRLTIMLDKHTAQPKGFAYIEFATLEGAQAALALNDSTLNGRQIKVTPKRTNVPGLKAGRGRGRGGRGGAAAGMMPHYPPMMMPYGYPYPPPGPYGYPPMGPPPPAAYPGYGYPPPPPPHHGGYHAGGAYRRGGGYQQGGRGGGRYNPYGGGRGGYQRGGGRGGRGGGYQQRGGYHGHGRGDGDRDDMFVPNDNQQLPAPGQHEGGYEGGEHAGHDHEYQHHQQGEGGAEYPVEEPAGRW
ncbi:hypothetical protein BCR44DRAFT_39608 [Catenaria anguillulae PL171]|uniref:RRM domain-containing protein n=1 Tax=Catenaria anguillulae PL171 TaxID=765915 RepID=A0A1Y2H7T7_9FUNG|nr:hypothetical protein BCR44DRAFT_39608 [Catenaria anguillulae PL171]